MSSLRQTISDAGSDLEVLRPDPDQQPADDILKSAPPIVLARCLGPDGSIGSGEILRARLIGPVHVTDETERILVKAKFVDVGSDGFVDIDQVWRAPDQIAEVPDLVKLCLNIRTSCVLKEATRGCFIK